MDYPLTPVHSHSISGECYAVTLSANTATNANVRIGIGIFPNNIAKSVFIYRAVINNNDTAEGDITISTYTTIDAHFTNLLTPVNTNLGSANTSLCTVKGSPTGSNAPNSVAGTTIAIYRLTGSNLGFECFQNGSGIYVPANTSNVAALFYAKVPTIGKYGILHIEYIEY